MNWLTQLAHLFVPEPYQQRETDLTSFADQLAAIRSAQSQARPWRPASVTEALGVPAILGAVTLISNTVGSLSLEAYRSGALVVDQTQVPRILVRPNPLSKPFDFFRNTAFYNGTRGEFWWWVAHRDLDGIADALYPVPPWEIRVERNDRNLLRPRIYWLDRLMPNEDMRHHMYLPDPSGLRGVGPLQLAGAAVSVAVEADAWAGNFFSGSLPSLIGTTEQELSPSDIDALNEQWLEKPNNVPRWLYNGVTMTEPPYNAQKAQLTESRGFQVGEVARMFVMPGELIEYQMGGSSLTYKNEEGIWTDFQRRCLTPNYLEPIEQEMSDQLTRSTVARFSLDQLLRADVETRYKVHGMAIEKGIYGPEYAQQKEGILPGNVDFAPVPFAQPSAVPDALPYQRRELEDLHCTKCGRLAGRFQGAAEVKCGKCGAMVTSAA